MTWTRRLSLLGILTLILLLYFVVPVHADARGGPVLRAVLALLVLVGLAVLVLRQVWLTAVDDERKIDGLVAGIALVLVVFSLGYYVLDQHRPDEVEGLVTRLDSLYFSATTMLTIGYGDIHATGQIARALVLAQMAFDVVFVATAASVLTARVRRSTGARMTARNAQRDDEGQERSTQRNPT